VYLVDISKRSVVDSVLVKGDTVVFSELWTPGFIPYMVSIERNDTFQGHALPTTHRAFKVLIMAKFIYSSFYLDKGVTIIKPYLTSFTNKQSDFIGSKQNEPFLKGVELEYAKENAVDRHAIITKNISKIKAHPYSIHLLEQLFRYKGKVFKRGFKKSTFLF
jgi:hypothetical protein